MTWHFVRAARFVEGDIQEVGKLKEPKNVQKCRTLTLYAFIHIFLLLRKFSVTASK